MLLCAKLVKHNSLKVIPFSAVVLNSFCSIANLLYKY
jgi:hypothetical protein